MYKKRLAVGGAKRWGAKVRTAGRLGVGSGWLAALSAPILFLNPRVDLLTVDLDLGRGLDPQFALPVADLQDGDLDRITNPDVFSQLPCEHKHCWCHPFGLYPGQGMMKELGVIAPSPRYFFSAPRNYHVCPAMSNLTPQAKAIIRTLAYYDVFDYPLTVEELWRWYFPESGATENLTVEKIEAMLGQEPVQSLVERQGKFVVLKGRRHLVQLRAERIVVNEKKWRRAVTAIKYLQVVPFIKMIAVVNTLAINNARPESDIDFLIVSEPGHIWSTRMAVTGIVSMLGYRRHGEKITNRICLSFYLTTDALDLEPLKREADDPHFAFWASQAVPLLDHGTYEKYVQANDWVTKLLPNAWQWDWRKRLVRTNPTLDATKTMYQAFFQSPVGMSLESWSRDHQHKRFEANTNSKSSESNTDVIISEDVLKFHEADRRLEYGQKFYDRLKSLGL